MKRNTVILLVGLVVLILVIQAAEGKKEKDSDESGEKKDKKKKKGDESDEVIDEDDADGSKSKEDKKKKPKGFFKHIKTCQGQEWEQPKALIKGTKKCEEKHKKDAEEKKKDAKKGPICAAACLWKENDLFTGEAGSYKVDSKAIEEFVDEMLPAGYLKPGRPALKKNWKACKKEIDNAEPDDEKCARYSDYFKCIKKTFRKHCGGAEGPGAHGAAAIAHHGGPAGLLGGLLMG